MTAECAAPLLVVGGQLVVSEPPDVDLVDRWPTEPLAALGFAAAKARQVETDDGVVHLAVLQLEELAADRIPRRVGVPAKRPLF